MLSFHVKFCRQKDKRTDRRKTVKQYASDLSLPEHKNAAYKRFLKLFSKA